MILDGGSQIMNSDVELICGIVGIDGNRVGIIMIPTALERLNLINNTLSELHVLIDWTCYFSDIEIENMIPYKSLIIVDKIIVRKLINKKTVISKFYNTYVDDFRGKTDFILYILKDINPKHDYRNTSKGNRKVNIHLFDFKKLLRKITGGYKIHATDNIQETKDNLKTLGFYDKYYNEKTFDTLQDVFNELNKYPQLKWVVMRNFKDMPR